MKARTLAQLLDYTHDTMSETEFDVFVGKMQSFLKARGLEDVAASAATYLSRIEERRAQEDTLVIETPHALTESAREDVQKFFLARSERSGGVGDAKDIVIEERVDPELIGGFRGTRNHNSIDATLATQLNKLERELVKG